MAAAVSTLSLLCWLVLTIVADSALTALSASSPGPGGTPVPLAVVITIVVIAVLWLVLIYLMFQGQNWCRVLLVIFGGIGLAGEMIAIIGLAVYQTLGPDNLIQIGLGVLVCGLALASIAMMFQEPANAYFRPGAVR